VVFSSPIFLFCFLPVALLLYYVAPATLKNIVLLIISLLFYAWGEAGYVSVMLVSIGLNYVSGLLIFKYQENKFISTLYLLLSLILNIGILVYFKYYNFILDNIDSLFTDVKISHNQQESIHLPLGISFFTFQAISYIVDVYRKEVPAQKNILSLGLYISLFPQLIAGPIVRYHDIAAQIKDRLHSIDVFSSGVTRFIYGLSKKILIANPLGSVADSVFSLSSDELTFSIAWIGVFAYALQIYFDFSGYSDMAIGLGRMFGFRFLENFNYPYISRSLREFWKRWHISLSTWFRDYVYIALGGNRVPTWRVYINLFIVFMLTGIWHGASWNFLLWGLFHGFFITCEHAGFNKILERLWKPIQHCYLISVILFSWVLFRSEDIDYAINYMGAMLDIDNMSLTRFQIERLINNETIIVFLVGGILSMPLYRLIHQKLFEFQRKNNGVFLVSAFQVFVPVILMVLSIVKVSSSTYNPFIYFRF